MKSPSSSTLEEVPQQMLFTWAIASPSSSLSGYSEFSMFPWSFKSLMTRNTFTSKKLNWTVQKAPTRWVRTMSRIFLPSALTQPRPLSSPMLTTSAPCTQMLFAFKSTSTTHRSRESLALRKLITLESLHSHLFRRYQLFQIHSRTSSEKVISLASFQLQSIRTPTSE